MGDRVEAKVAGWTKYYVGEVKRKNSDGTYDIIFDDGEKKSRVLSRQMRREGSNSARSNTSSKGGSRGSSRTSSPRIQYEKYDRVEAKVKGWTKYYGGEVIRVNDDGTYDLKFDDGEKKSKVKTLYMRKEQKKR